MSAARNKLVASTEHIKTLRAIVIICLMIILALWIRNGSLQETQRLFIPPDLAQGAVVEFDQVPPPVIYTFASYIFQQLNRWKNNGDIDYRERIYTLQGYLTPSCIQFLTNDMNRKRKLGELRSRVRSIETIDNEGYVRQRVSIESKGSSWLTWLDFTIRETISGHPVKNINVRYKLRVVKFDVDKEVNPWGLAIACDETTNPILLSKDDLAQPFRQQEFIQ